MSIFRQSDAEVERIMARADAARIDPPEPPDFDDEDDPREDPDYQRELAAERRAEDREDYRDW
jgi:hypothetical protein